jgi:hypothetical protein
MTNSKPNDNTNAIDNKKKENQTGTTRPSPNYNDFAYQLFLNTIRIIFVYGIIGSIGLYTCKVAQANILPNNVDYFPFSDEIKKVEQIPINVNVIKEYGFFGLGWIFGQSPKTFSTKIEFDPSEIFKSYENGLIGMLNSFKTNPNRSNFFPLYIRDVLVNIIAINNYIIDKTYSVFNQFLPESIILLLYPLFLLFFMVFMLFVNMGLSFFYQLKCVGDFFMKKEIKDNKVVWKDPDSYFQLWRLFCLFLYSFFFFPVVFLLPLFIFLYTTFSPLFNSGKIQNTQEKYSFSDFLIDTFLYKSQLFIILLTITLFTTTYSTLGPNATVGCVFGILIVFFIFHLYNQYIPKNDTNVTPGLVSSKEASDIVKGGVNITGGGSKHKKHKK